MTGPDLLHEVAASLEAHRTRTVLAATGIVAGVATIVAALAIAGGARRQAIADLGALGTDTVIVRTRVRTGAGRNRLAPLLALDDAVAIGERFPGATASAVRLMPDTVESGRRSAPAVVAGVTPDWHTATGIELLSGRWLRQADAQETCAVIGFTLARTLFGLADPIGQTILAAGEWRTIIGVLSDGTARPRSSLQILSADDTVFVPFRTMDVSIGTGDSGAAADEIVVRLPAGDDAVLAAAETRALVTSRHDDDDGAFDLLVPSELLQARLRTERRSQMLLLAVGGLALFISGVGIMNIMVASVTERSPEIGVRRAVGARRRSVLIQFAAEAASLGAMGGALGVPAGVLAAWLVSHLAGWPVAVSVVDVGVALATGIGVAVAAGLYPARLAASVSPIDALR